MVAITSDFTIFDRSILITGGTGTLGHALVQHLLPKKPKRLIIFSRDEWKQSEMCKQWPDTEGPLRYFLGDVRDYGRLRRAFAGVDIVIHAAALKQIASGEYNPAEVVRTNVIGGQNVIEAALDCRVKKVLMAGTDKACSPTNLYGASKLVSEKLFIQANSYSGADGTRFAVCRYGNVVGSRGSVVPLFQEQAKIGEITITDARMTRFWITQLQAVQLVCQSLNLMRGGEVFVPKLPSCSVVDLAEAVAPGVPIRYMGIRPGEKLHESLISEEEARGGLDLGGMYLIQPQHPWWAVEPHMGIALPDGWSFRSDTNVDRLGVEDIRALLGGDCG